MCLDQAHSASADETRERLFLAGTLAQREDALPMKSFIALLCVGFTLSGPFWAKSKPPSPLKIESGTHLVLLGNGLGSRMMRYGHFETEMQRRYAT